MKYLWEPENTPEYPALEGGIETDVLIIGGGMAGVLCAYKMTEAGADCVLVEGDVPGNGTTRGTTAVLTAQHDTLYTDLVKKHGEAAAKRYLHRNLRAVESFRELSREIPCGFETRPSFMYTCGTKGELSPDALRREAEFVRRLGFPAEFVEDAGLPFAARGAVRYPHMAQFDPLELLHGLASRLRVYAHTFVRKIDLTTNTAHTDQGKIKAEKIVVATHFPLINRFGAYFMKLYQMRSYVKALENAPRLEGTYVGTGKSSLYFRNAGDLLLIGGGDHRTGKAPKDGGMAYVSEAAKRLFPNAETRFEWAAQDCTALDGVPYIGRYSRFTPDLFVATGFNEWGMTTSMLAAELLTAQVLDDAPEDPLFTPQRSMLHPQLFVNLWETAAHVLRPTAPRCSHLGCALIWNKSEHTWDCACHGSRFSPEGAVLENPAMRDIRPRTEPPR